MNTRPTVPPKPIKVRRTTPVGARPHKAVFRCSCGNYFEAQEQAIASGVTASCGCYRRAWMAWRNAEYRNTRHGHTPSGEQSPTYQSWLAMRKRCYNPKSNKYKYYGGRGIKVCDEWRDSFDAFLTDMGERPEGMTIDRVDNERDYAPGNCRWATRAQQRANRRKHFVVSEEAAKADLLPGARRVK